MLPETEARTRVFQAAKGISLASLEVIQRAVKISAGLKVNHVVLREHIKALRMNIQELERALGWKSHDYL